MRTAYKVIVSHKVEQFEKEVENFINNKGYELHGSVSITTDPYSRVITFTQALIYKY